MQLQLPFGKAPTRARKAPAPDLLTVGRRTWMVTYVRHRRARHYILHVEDDGNVRVTIPRGGSRQDAERFAKQKAGWIERERYRRALANAGGRWHDGSRILLRGEYTLLRVDPAAGVVRLGLEEICAPADGTGDLRPAVTRYLREMATRELADRLMALAAAGGHRVARVTIRDQKSRWGSCSPSGCISLNWRLIQVPAFVRDYVILHELTHLTVPNHSTRFWMTLNQACPWHRDARAWLKGHFSGAMGDPWTDAAGSGPRMPEPAAHPQSTAIGCPLLRP